MTRIMFLKIYIPNKDGLISELKNSHNISTDQSIIINNIQKFLKKLITT